MKKSLLLLILFAFSITLYAQTNTWTGAGANTNWNTVANWSLNAVPTAANDVVIPTGYTVNLNVAAPTKSLVVQGNSTLNIAQNVSFLNASSFGANTTVIWSDGGLYGGGTLTNNGTLNMTSASTKSINDNTILNNNGAINMSADFVLYINSGGINNQSSGVIDISAQPNLSPNTNLTHSIVNSGIIKKTTGTGTAIISVALVNSGTISVESGILNLTSETKSFNGGVYNVTTGATLAMSTGINLSGTLTGIVNGDLNWNSTIAVDSSATFSFTGSAGINWVSGTLDGGGTLNNGNKMNIISDATKIIAGNTILSNTGTINCLSNFVLYINAGTLNNLNSGVIDIQGLSNFSPNTNLTHSIVNSGLIKKTTDSGVAIISVAMTNTGTIAVQNGTLSLTSETKTFNGGVYNVTAGATLDLSTNININNTLTGLVNGNLNWNSNLFVATTASFNFTGAAGIKWIAGSLDGGGTLTNMSKLNLTSDSTKLIYSATTLSNTGTINCTDNFVLYINQGIINNQPTGVLDIQGLPNFSPNTNLSHKIINSGLIKKTTNAGIATISVALTNTGTLTVESGTLNLTSEAKTFNGGIYNVSSGAVLNLSTQILCSGTFTGALAGSMSWNNELNVATGITATLNFTGATGLNWNSGSLNGGGTLKNTSKLNIMTNDTKSIVGGTNLKNSGTLNCLNDFVLYINEGVINNETSGVLDIKDSPNFSPNTNLPHSMVNSGLIKKTVGTGTAIISVALTNTGTISVESGTLNLTSEVKTFNGGTYNVSNTSVLNLSTQVICSGLLTGSLIGPMSWNSVVSVAAANPATFNFTGTSGINWAEGSLAGGGTLTNAGKMNLTTGSSKFISEATTLSNTGTINCLNDFVLYINQGILNNQISGIIDIKALPIFSPNTNLAHSIVNSGLIKKTSNAGVAQINVNFTNSGTIDSQMGNLQINANPFVNTVDGVIKGTATLGLPAVANYTNDGTFAPGGSPGTLTVIGDYKSTATSVLDVELLGITPNTGYDVLAITGNAVFAGTVNVTLGFAPVLNNEFIVATTTGIISQCNLASSTSADFGGMTYTFTVSCRNNNQVVLKVTNIALGIEEFELTASSIQLYPNPVLNTLNIKNVNQLELIDAQIMDVTGKTMTTFNLKDMGLTKEISLENYATGLYFVKINAVNGSITKRIVKQ